MHVESEAISRSSQLRPNHREALGRFVELWGEMASKWGISRTMAQVHALLYASEHPMDTDTIMEILRISRGNANMNLRSLIKWSLVEKVHIDGSRRDYFTAEKDVWVITQQIVRHRERKELAPVKKELEHCRTLLSDGTDMNGAEEMFEQRIANLINLVDLFQSLIETGLPFMEEKNIPLLRSIVTALPKDSKA